MREIAFLELSRGNFKTKEPLNELEMNVLDRILEMSDFQSGKIASNKMIARDLGVGKRAVARARVSLSGKIDIIPNGF